jgi:hypothetical protein
MVLEEEGRVTSCVDRRIIQAGGNSSYPLVGNLCPLFINRMEDLVTGDLRILFSIEDLRILLPEIFCDQ